MFVALGQAWGARERRGLGAVSSEGQMVIVSGGYRGWRVGPPRQSVVHLSALMGFLVPLTGFALSGESSCAGIEREHSAWGSLLGKYVHDGLVDYESWKRQGMAELNNYLA